MMNRRKALLLLSKVKGVVQVGLPNWMTNNIDGYIFLSALQNESVETFDYTVDDNSNSAPTGSNKYSGAVLAPNGYIYVIPNSYSLGIMKLNTSDYSYTHISCDTNYGSPVLAPNGCIYAIPNSTLRKNILKINTNTDEVSYIGDLTSETTIWIGGNLATNGKIYYSPYSSNTVLVLDPSTDTISQFGDLSSLGLTSKYRGFVLAPNNKLYGIPASALEVIEIDTELESITPIGSTYTGSNKWSSGIIGVDGNIYCTPFNDVRILKIDTLNKTTTTIGSLPYQAARCIDAVLAPNNNIIFTPNQSDYLLELNTTTSIVTYRNITSTANSWVAGVLTKNGKIVIIPKSTTEFTIIGSGGLNLDDNRLLSRYLNN